MPGFISILCIVVPTSPTLRTGLAELAQIVFAVTDFADRRAAVDVNLSHFARPKSNCRVGALTSGQLCRTASRPNQLSALARLHLDIVYRRTNRNRTNRQRVARLNWRVFATNDWRPRPNAFRRQNIATLAVCVLDQCQVRAAIGVVLQAFNNTRNAILATLEVDNAVMLLWADRMATT